jgi:hypothetical protein
MSGIEFLETDAGTGGGEPPVPVTQASTDRPGAVLWWLTAGCWAVAALLAVLAAYQPVLRVSYGSGPGSYSYSVDAWGRYSGGGSAEAVLRGPGYAPVLCALAVVFTVLAGYSVVRAMRRVSGTVSLTATILALTATAFFAGLTLAMRLQVSSTLESVRANVHRLAGLGDPVRGDVDTAVGACLGFAVGALIAAVLAAVLGHPAVRHRLSGPRVTKSRRRVGPDLAG